MPDDRDIDRLDRRLDSIETRIATLDSTGTRGVVVVQEQIRELTRDLAKVEPAIDALRAEVKSQFTLHEASHLAEERRRTSRTRWLIGTALTIGGLGGGFVGHVIEQLLGHR